MIISEVFKKIDSVNIELILADRGLFRAENQDMADRVVCFCPFCGKNTPHFVIFKMIHGGVYGGTKWFCTKTQRSGYGAISLMAALLGCAGYGEGLLRVCREICRIAHFDDLQPLLSSLPLQTEVPARDKVYVNFAADFSTAALQALGCKVSATPVSHPKDSATPLFSFSPLPPAEAFLPVTMTREFRLQEVMDYTTAALTRHGEKVSLKVTATPFSPIFVLFRDFLNAEGNPFTVGRIIHATQPSRDFLYIQKGEGSLSEVSKQLCGDRVFCAVLDGSRVPEAVASCGSDEYLETVVTETVYDDGKPTEQERKLEPEDVRAESVVYCPSPLDAISTYYHLNALRPSYPQMEAMQKIHFHVAFPLKPQAHFSVEQTQQLYRFAKECYMLFPADNEGKKQTFLCGKRYRNMRMAFLPAPFMESRKADKSVCAFFRSYQMTESERYSYGFDLHRYFLSCFTSALTANPLEYCEKVDKKTGKVKEYWYKVDSASLWPFMASEGYCREVDHDSSDIIGRFIHIDGPFVKEIDARSVVAATVSSLCDYAQQSARVGSQDFQKMKNAIIMAKEINVNTAVNLPEMEVNYNAGYGPELDHFFYKNGALRITPTSITFVPYDKLDFNVDRAEILPWNFTMPCAPGEPPFRIIENPEYVARLNEIEEHKKDKGNYTMSQIAEARGQLMQWSQTHRWQFDFGGKKESEMWPALRVLRCFANEEWEKEEELHRRGEEFNEEENNLLMGHLANIIFSLGRPLFRYRNTAHNCIPYLLENKVSSENKAEGGSGKSVFANVFMGCAGKILRIDGRNIKADKEFSLHLAAYQHHCHRVIHWEDLDSIPLTDLYNYATSGFSYRRLYQDVMTIKFSESPGHIISSNKSPLKADDSTMRRISLTGFSHRFAGENVHKNKPARLISDVMPGFQTEAELLPEEDRNQIAYLCALAVQFCMNCHDKVSAPQTDVKNRTMARNLGESFVRWANYFFDQEWAYNAPIDLDTIFDEYKDFCESSEDKRTKFARSAFREKIKQYCELNGIIFMPEVCLTSKSERARGYMRKKAWHVKTFFDDVRTWGEGAEKKVRVLEFSNVCVFFSKAGSEPKTIDEVKALCDKLCKSPDPNPILDENDNPVVLTDEEKQKLETLYNYRQGKRTYNAPEVDTAPAVPGKVEPNEDMPF